MQMMRRSRRRYMATSLSRSGSAGREFVEAAIAVGQATIDAVLGTEWVLRSNTAGTSYSQGVRFGGEVDAPGGTIRQQIGATKAHGRIWFDCGRFVRRQQQWSTPSCDDAEPDSRGSNN